MKLTSEQKNNLANYYCKNNLLKLKAMCTSLISRKRMWIYYDELLDQAMITLAESLNSYDNKKGSKFNTYLYGNIQRSFYDWTRDNLRFKRCNIETDENGIIKIDEDGMPIIITSVSFDCEFAESNLKEKIPSDFDIFKEAFDTDFSGTKIENYLNKLSNKQRKIVSLLSEGYKANEIRELLHVNKKEYSNNLAAIQAYENVRELM